MPIQTLERKAPVRVERRKNLRMRQCFEEARSLIEPLLGQDPLKNNGAAFYRALRKLQEAFPELSAMEVEALVASVVRAIANRSGK